MDANTWVAQGNLVTTTPALDRPGHYQANGRFGAVWGPYGLHAPPAWQEADPWAPRSRLTHLAHWGRFRFRSDATGQQTTADYLLPLARLYWEQTPAAPTAYRQEQDFFTGLLTTAFTAGGASYRVQSWMDAAHTDLAVVTLELSAPAAVRLTGVTRFVPYPFLYKQPTAQTVTLRRDGPAWGLEIGCPNTINDSSVTLWLTTDAPVESCPDGVRLLAGPGATHILLQVGCPAALDEWEESRRRTQRAWQDRWARTGWFCFPDARAQQMYVRSLAYLLSTYSESGGPVPPTNGLTGNMFPFHFVQDLGYIAPALLLTGHGAVVRRWVETFAGQIPAMQRYARHLWPEAGGVYPPWELPYGDMDHYHRPGVPVPYCYEPHNVGYLCQLAVQAAQWLGDPAWTRRFAAPLIRECAAFYLAFCRKAGDGHWHLRWTPSIGQDEAGGRNGSDYLCSLYSAQYTFRAAVAFGQDADGACRRVLADGLAFAALRDERGLLHTAAGADDFGRQKHPVQLDGLAYLPTGLGPQPEERRAYALRHQITARAGEPFYFGWTLGELLLAGSNLGEVTGWRQDWGELRTSNYTDPDWVQVYETSGEAEKSFYLTTHGLLVQSLIRNYVNDYWDTLVLGGCPVFEGPVQFGGIQTRFGVEAAGQASGGRLTWTLSARRDTHLPLDGAAHPLQKGEIFHGKRLLSLG